MNKVVLIEAARGLEQPSAEIADEFEATCGGYAHPLTEALRNRPDLSDLIGSGNMELMETNHENQARFMCGVMRGYDPAMFVNILLWVFKTYRVRGFSKQYWRVQLSAVLCILKDCLSPAAYSGIAPFYRWILDHIDVLDTLSEQESTPWDQGQPQHGNAPCASCGSQADTPSDAASDTPSEQASEQASERASDHTCGTQSGK